MLGQGTEEGAGSGDSIKLSPVSLTQRATSLSPNLESAIVR